MKDISDEPLRGMTLPRFIKYARIATPSDRHAEGKTPSTAYQWDLAHVLEEDLRSLGLSDVELTDKCYVLARLPASPGLEGKPTVGFLAHMDVSPDAPGLGVEPIVVDDYDGKPIHLADGLLLDPGLEPELAACKGQSLVHSGGKTLLGADDKAGVAAIMGAIDYLIRHPETKHGEIEIIFSPDEEIGAGLEGLPVETLHSKACYTLDGGSVGYFEAECFNALAARVSFRGRSIHPGSARGRLINAATMAAVFTAMLPRNESPEATDGYWGFYCPSEIQGNHEAAIVELIIRDFDMKEAERRLEALSAFAKAVEAQFPGGKVTIESTVQYLNMKQKLDEHPEVLDKLKAAAENLQIGFQFVPIRGGTDGSRLTQLGIPTPNIFTGGHNFHGRSEWLSVTGLCQACSMVIELARLWGK